MIPAPLIGLITSIASKKLTETQTIGEAVKTKTNMVAFPFLTAGVGLVTTEHWKFGVVLMFGSLVSMTIRDTLAKLIKLQETKN